MDELTFAASVKKDKKVVLYEYKNTYYRSL